MRTPTPTPTLTPTLTRTDVGYPLGSSPVAHQQSTLHPLRREQQLLLSALRPAHGNAFAELASVVGSGLGLLAQGLAGGFGSFLAASAPDPIAEERQQNSGKGEGNVSTDGDVATVVVFILGGITAHEVREVYTAMCAASSQSLPRARRLSRVILVTTDIVSAADVYQQLFQTTLN